MVGVTQLGGEKGGRRERWKERQFQQDLFLVKFKPSLPFGELSS